MNIVEGEPRYFDTLTMIVVIVVITLITIVHYFLSPTAIVNVKVEEDLPSVKGFTDFIDFSKSMASYYLGGTKSIYTEFNISFSDGYTVTIKALYGCCGYYLNSTLYCNKTLVANYYEGEIGEYNRLRYRSGRVYVYDLFMEFVEKYLRKVDNG